MLEIQILSGKQAGAVTAARHFPFAVGRAADAHLCLDDSGVFDRHLELIYQPREGFFLHVCPEAIVSVNGQPVSEARLQPGDVLDMGSVKLRVFLAPAVQRGLKLRECVTWGVLAALTLGQVAACWWLLSQAS